jgi:Ca2+-binding EF-hand superfamily protein
MPLLSKNERLAADAARLHMRRVGLQFDEACGDGDRTLSFEEFCAFTSSFTTNADIHADKKHQDKELRAWWALINENGDARISKCEFFLYSLCAASRKCGTGIQAIFQKFDGNSSGNLDVIEFEKALDVMGFGDCASEVFDEHVGPHGAVSYLRMLKRVETKSSLPELRAFLAALASDTRKNIDTSQWAFGGATPEEARDGLAALLMAHHVRLSDLFQQWDDDGSFSLTLEELKDCFTNEMGFIGPTEVVEQIFCEQLDQDGSGKIAFDEFSAWVHGRAIAPQPSERDLASRLSLVPRLQASFDAGDQAWSAGRLRSELHAELGLVGLRVVDLLRAWDTGTKADEKDERNDDLISHREFLIALKKLAGGGELWYQMGRDGAVAAFGRMDRSGDKSISVGELQRWLDPHSKLAFVPHRRWDGADCPSSPLKRDRRTAFHAHAGGAAKTEEEEEEEEEEGSLCYSPTKISTRLAQVRAYAPDMDRASRLAARLSRPRWPAAPPPSSSSLMIGAPDCVRERVWSTRRAPTSVRLGPTSAQPFVHSSASAAAAM